MKRSERLVPYKEGGRGYLKATNSENLKGSSRATVAPLLSMRSRKRVIGSVISTCLGLRCRKNGRLAVKIVECSMEKQMYLVGLS